MNHPCGSLEGLPGADSAPLGVRPTNPFVEFTPEEMEQSILARFERQVACHAERPAVLEDGQALSYADLDRWANRIARALLDRRGPSAEPVGLLIGRAIPMVAAILGTLKAGKVYLPLEPRFPTARLRQIVGAAGVSVVVFDHAHQHLAGEVAPEPTAQIDVECATKEYPGTPPAHPVGPDHVCYLLYTSGSTGQPRGVYQNHRNLLHHIREHTNELHIASTDRVALLAPFSAAASIHVLLGALLNGAALYPFDVKEHGAERLAQWLEAQRITLYHSVPAVFRQVAAALGPDQTLPHLRLIRMGGDLVLPGDVELYREHFAPGCILVVSFGASESHTICWRWLDKGTPVPTDVVPVGRPVGGAEVLVQDERGEPVPFGQVGEIAVRSRHLALGYWNDPGRTRASFSGPDEMGRRTWCTGDLGRQLPDGCLVHLGRRDFRVKIRGQAVDLVEVEACLTALAPVREACVIAPPGRDGIPCLVGYVVPAGEGTVNPSALRAELSRTLPDFMVPTVFVRLDALPRTSTGKVDRQALPAVEESQKREREYLAPRTLLEEHVAGLWAEVLGLARVGVHDDFFERGGHSLLAGRLLARVNATFEVDLPLRCLFEAPTVAGLAGAVAEAREEGRTSDPLISRGKTAGPFPLSFAQQRLWFLDRLDPNQPLYNVHRAVRLRGILDVTALQRALDALVARHEVLRTIFAPGDDGPVQVIAAQRVVPMAIRNPGDDPAQRGEADVRRLLQDEVRRPFDLSADVMLRAALFRLQDNEHVLLLVTHHIAADGWSMAVLLGELAVLYEAFAAGKPSPLSELPIQYADFTLWERRRLEGNTGAALLDWWRRQLEGAPIVLELPTTRARPSIQTFAGACQSLILPGHLVDSVRALGRREGATLFMVLLAAFKVLLHRYTSGQDVVVGSPTAGRNRVEVEGLVGFFANTLVLRSRLSGDLSFLALLAKVRETTLGAQAHQELPFERLVEELRPERTPGVMPLVQVMFAFQNAPRNPLRLPGLAVEPVEIHNGAARFDLTLAVVEEDGLRATLEYRTDLFEPDAMDRLLGHYRTLLEGAVADPERGIGDLPLLTDPERELLVRWSAAPGKFERGSCVHESFERQMSQTPDAVAVVCEDQRLTYRELNARANQLAHHLRTLAVAPDTLVAVGLPRSIELVVAVLSIWKAGGAYVALDPAYPEERLRFMLADSQAAVLVTTESLAARLAAGSARLVLLDADREVIDRQPDSCLEHRVGPDNLAYVLYTSGSTGRPKGVAVVHRGPAALLNWGLRTFTHEQLAGMLFSTSLCFDLSVFELVAPLGCGGRIIVVPDALHLPECPAAGDVTFINTVPSVMAELVRRPGLPTTVKVVVLCGEVLTARLAQECYQVRGVEHVFNLYGPTETTVYATFCRVSEDEVGPPSIGRPIGGTRACILDERLRPVPIGVPGELYLGGAGLARGYLNRPALTAERFLPDSFIDGAGERLYRTGDRCRYRADGSLEFLGRLDNQVKVRGFRIELGEIEATLEEHPRVRETAVLVREDSSGDKRLTAYVVPRGQAPAALELRDFVQQKLPGHMVPTTFVILERMPLAPNGKVDRRGLPAPDRCRAELEQARVPPRNEIETRLAAIWAEVLGLDRVGVHDNFFDLGGHSLLAVKLFNRIEKTFGQTLPLASLFQGATVERMAVLLDERARPGVPGQVLVLQPHGSRPPLFLLPSIVGDLLHFQELLRHLGADQPVYGLLPCGDDGTFPDSTRLEEMAERILHGLRAFRPKGPYCLAGYSFGGALAYELAQQLTTAGQHVGLLAFIDTGLPGDRPPTLLDVFRSLPRILANLPRWIRDDLFQSRPGILLGRLRRKLRAVWQKLQGFFGRAVPSSEYVALDELFDMERFGEHFRRRLEMNHRAWSGYRARAYPGRVTLLRARTRKLWAVTRRGPGLRGLVAGGVEVCLVPGTHESILVEPHVRVLAQRLRDCLAECVAHET
jgi:amino acid adenylation domain-containing protein